MTGMSTGAHEPPDDPTGDPLGDPADDPADGSGPGAREPDPDYRLLALAAIVPAVIIVAILVRIVVNRPHDSNAHPATLTVTVPAQTPSSGCGPADASTLAAQGNALEATVTGISGRTVTLQPERVFKGEHYSRVQVELPTGTPPAALRLPRFSDGTTYLLAVAPDGTLSGCGLTGTESSALERVYTSAFG
jgi:hypothetical protein